MRGERRERFLCIALAAPCTIRLSGRCNVTSDRTSLLCKPGIKSHHTASRRHRTVIGGKNLISLPSLILCVLRRVSSDFRVHHPPPHRQRKLRKADRNASATRLAVPVKEKREERTIATEPKMGSRKRLEMGAMPRIELRKR